MLCTLYNSQKIVVTLQLRIYCKIAESTYIKEIYAKKGIYLNSVKVKIKNKILK